MLRLSHPGITLLSDLLWSQASYWQFFFGKSWPLSTIGLFISSRSESSHRSLMLLRLNFGTLVSVLMHRPIWPRSTPCMSCASRLNVAWTWTRLWQTQFREEVSSAARVSRRLPHASTSDVFHGALHGMSSLSRKLCLRIFFSSRRLRTFLEGHLVRSDVMRSHRVPLLPVGRNVEPSSGFLGAPLLQDEVLWTSVARSS